MLPVLASAAFGFLKGFLVPGAISEGHWLHSTVLGPLSEELFYRGMPLRLSRGKVPAALTAAIFAMDHMKGLPSEATGTQTAARFADTFAGGLLYDKAYRSGGLGKAFAAHALHNAAVRLGIRLREGRGL